MRKISIAALLIMSIMGSASAQEAYSTNVVNFTPQFLLCVIAGVLLALGFQVLLTVLSAASGISMVGNVQDKVYDSSDKDYNKELAERKRDREESKLSLGVKVTSGIGIWAMLTASISLFFASMLAVKLSLIPANSVGITLGLVIWATFMIIMLYVEIRSVSSVLGSLFTAAVSGIRSSAGAVSKMFAPTAEQQITKAAENTVEAISRKLSMEMNSSGIGDKIDEYIQKLQPREIDYEKIKYDLVNMLSDVELKEQTESTDEGILKRIFIDTASRQPHISRAQLKKLGDTFQEARAIASSDKSKTDKLIEAVDKFTPGTEEDTRRIREKIADYLRSTQKAELNPDTLQKDFERIMRDPVSSKEIIREKVKVLDKATIANVLSQRTDMDRQEAEKVLNYVENAWNSIKATLFSSADKAQEKKDELTGRVQDVKERFKPSNLAAAFEDKVRNYLNSMNRDEFNYEKIKLDFQTIFNDPSLTFDVLKGRLSQFDRESLIALLDSSDRISRADAERIVSKIEEARDTVLNKAKDIEITARQKYEAAKAIAVREAENTRKVAAAATWWALATIIVSGIASAIGGIIAL